MDVVTKSVDAAVAPIESDFPGQFEVILSTETMDRDDENLWADEWKTPLPARIHIDGDHGRSLEKTVGSAVPTIEGNRMIGKGTYAGTEYAQMVRQLVNEGHINSVSVTYAEKKNQKNDGVQRELLNAAFVAIPANPEAVVLASKSAKIDKDAVDASGNPPDVKHDDMVQAIHDAACHLGAQCLNEIDADPGTSDGANKSLGAKSVGAIYVDVVPRLPRPVPASVVVEEKSSSPEAGPPQESAEESAVPAAAEKSAAAGTAEESADDSVKAKAAAKTRALAFLIKQNTPDEG